MTDANTAKITKKRLSFTAGKNIPNFPINPAVKGIPAMDNNEIEIVKANNF